jgi:hypothetical protein
VRAAAVLALASCAVQHHVAVTGRALHDALPDLRAHGQANVDTIHFVDDEDDVHHVQEKLTFDQPIDFEHTHTTIREFTSNCRDVPPFTGDHVSGAPCPLVALDDAAFHVRDYTTRDIRGAILHGLTIATLGGTAGAFVCELACADGALKTASGYTLIGAGTLLVGTIVWAILDCRGRWGSSGCHD